MAVPIIEVIVIPGIGCRTDMRGRKPDRLLKAAIFGTVRVGVAEVPLAEYSGAIAGSGKDLGHCGKVPTQQRSSAADVHGRGGECIAPSHQLRACWSTHGRYMEIGEPDSFRI